MKPKHLRCGVFSASALIFLIKSSHVESASFTVPFLSNGVSGRTIDFEFVFGVVLANSPAIRNKKNYN